jgi:MazG family protein
MALLVVPLAPQEVGLLTLWEWDELCRRERVLFELEDHPLRARLAARGTEVVTLASDPNVAAGAWAVVADPASPRIVRLARKGAEVACPAHAVPDSLTAAHAAPIARRAAHSIAGLVAIMARLRSEDGCPWDREQTHRSLEVHLLEEAHEVLDAIEGGEPTDLEEELGDLLLQVVFHAQMAWQSGAFDLAGVADAIVAKLLRRHPHVFGESAVADASEVVRNWEAIKGDEKRRSGPFDGIPRSLPALLEAYKSQKRAAQLGFGADEDAARRAVEQALGAGGPDAVGEALFWTVAVARARGTDPETALRRATRSFVEALQSSRGGASAGGGSGA